MSEAVELATGWIRLVPSAEGVTDSIVDALAPSQKAAEDAGDRAGKGFSAKAKIGILTLGAAAVGGLVGLYKVGEIFDDVTDTIRVGTGATGEALDGLVESAKNVGSRVPAEFEKIGPTIADVNTRLGLTGDTLETVASQYLEAGRILGEEVDIQATSAAFSAFKIEGDAVVGAMDTLFQVSQATGVGMNELASGVQATAPALQTLGFSFEDTVALVGSLDKAGLNSTAVMAAMSKGMVTLAKDGEQPAEAFQRVVGELQGFVDTGDKAAALDLASQVFGTRGAAQFVGALESGTLNMNDLMAATGATGDTILGVGEETMDFAERWQILMNQAMLAIEPLASAVFTAIGDGLAGVMPLLEDFGTWLGENTWVLETAALIIGTVLVAAFAAWTAGVIANTVAMLAWPVTWIILGVVAAVGLLVAAGIWLWQNWDAVIAWIGEAWAGFMGWITGVIDGFVGWWNGVWSAVGAWIAGVWNGIVVAVQLAWIVVSSWVMGAINGFVGWWNGIWNAVGAWLSGVWNRIVVTVRVAWSAVSGWVQGAIGGFLGWWSGVWSGLERAWSGFWAGVGNIVRGAWEGIVSWIRGYVNSIISIINGMLGAISGIASAVSGLFGGGSVDLSIPMLADGGTITRSGSVIVGERGPELLNLPRGASVNPNIPEVVGGGGDTYILNGLTTRETAAEIARENDKRKRRNMARAGLLAGGFV